MTGLVPPAVAGLLAAGALILLGVLTVEQSYRAINWTTIILIGAMMPLSTAMYQSGAAAMLGEGLVDLVGDAGPYALLAGLFLLTGILGQLISNTATALIIIPISVAAAAQLGISPRPVLMSVVRRGGGLVPDPGRHAGEPDGDGPGRLPLRRLLEAGPAADDLVLRRRGVPRADDLAAIG